MCGMSYLSDSLSNEGICVETEELQCLLVNTVSTKR